MYYILRNQVHTIIYNHINSEKEYYTESITLINQEHKIM